MTDVPTWHGMDQVSAQHHESGPGSELVYSLHSLLGELHLLGPFLSVTVAVAIPPGFHQPQLRVRSLDEAKGSGPLTLGVWAEKKRTDVSTHFVDFPVINSQTWTIPPSSGPCIVTTHSCLKNSELMDEALTCSSHFPIPRPRDTEELCMKIRHVPQNPKTCTMSADLIPILKRA